MIITEEQIGQRLDKLLALAFPEHSRSRIKLLIEGGTVRVNGVVLRDASKKVQLGQEIELEEPEPLAASPEPQNIPLNVVFEDEHLIVIDKPAGLVVHPSKGHEMGTLVNALLYHCGASLSGINGVLRPGIVHRLDKDTAGLLVVAKHDKAHKGLAAQFADHGRTGPLVRQYSALVWGELPRMQGTIEADIMRSSHNREKMVITRGEGGRFAITHYEVEATYNFEKETPVVSRITCRLETGRTHQIRVHMAHIGHPLLGDKLYGTGFLTRVPQLPQPVKTALEALGRQALHAGVLGFEHPISGEEMYFESKMPDDLAALIAAMDT